MQFKITGSGNQDVTLPLLVPGVWLISVSSEVHVHPGSEEDATQSVAISGMGVTASANATAGSGVITTKSIPLFASLQPISDAPPVANFSLSGADATGSATLYICAERVGP